jgi:hypothetical protein
VKGKASREEEAFVDFKRQAYILWEGCTSRVVRCGREGDVDLVSFEGQDDSTHFQEGQLVAVGVEEDDA